MFHGISNDFLYSAYQIAVSFIDDIGNSKKGSGTCFFIEKEKNEIYLVTNRHILDPNYKKNNNTFKLQSIYIKGKDKDLNNQDFFITAPEIIFPESETDDIVIIRNFKYYLLKTLL